MAEINLSSVEQAIVEIVDEIKRKLGLDTVIDIDCIPGNLIRSQVLLTAMGRIGSALGVTIPNNRYIFHDTKKRQLTIKEAAQKLLNVTENGKQ